MCQNCNGCNACGDGDRSGATGFNGENSFNGLRGSGCNGCNIRNERLEITAITVAADHKRNAISLNECLNCCYCANQVIQPEVTITPTVVKQVVQNGYTYITVNLTGKINVIPTGSNACCCTPFAETVQIMFHEENTTPATAVIDGDIILTPIKRGCDNEVCAVNLTFPLNVTLED